MCAVRQVKRRSMSVGETDSNMQCTDFNTSEDLIALLQPIGTTWFSSGGIPGKTPNITIILLVTVL